MYLFNLYLTFPDKINTKQQTKNFMEQHNIPPPKFIQMLSD